MSGQLDFAHAAVILFASPSGTITRYLPGFKYADKDFRLALVEASEGKHGSLFDMVLQLCFNFDDSTGKYTANALTLMKFAGGVTVVTMGAIIGGMFFFERKRRLRLDADDGGGAVLGGLIAPRRPDPRRRVPRWRRAANMKRLRSRRPVTPRTPARRPSPASPAPPGAMPPAERSRDPPPDRPDRPPPPDPF